MQQPHDHAHLAVEAASVGDGRKHPAVGAQPALHARENRDGVFDVFEDMSENDVVEGPAGLVLLEERTLDLDGGVPLAERRTEDFCPLTQVKSAKCPTSDAVARPSAGPSSRHDPGLQWRENTRTLYATVVAFTPLPYQLSEAIPARRSCSVACFHDRVVECRFQVSLTSNCEISRFSPSARGTNDHAPSTRVMSAVSNTVDLRIERTR